MPRSMKKATTASKPEQHSASEIRQFEQDRKRQMYADATEALRQLSDVTKNQTTTVTAYTKEDLLNYLESIGSSEAQLRNISWYMYYRSQVYRRVVNFYAKMFCLDCRYISAPGEQGDYDIDTYYETINKVVQMNLPLEFLKVHLTCFLQDVYYGCGYLDETGFYILTLPPDYCKIYGNYEDDSIAFAMNMSYFNGSNASLLEYYGEPFTSMFKAYGGDNSKRWQVMPPEYAVCEKYNYETLDVIVTPMVGALIDIIGLEDVKNYQAIADEQEIYKLLYYKMSTMTGAKQPNQFNVDPNWAIPYINRFIQEALPDYTTFGMVPGGDDLGVVSFDTDKVSDVSKTTKATLEVLNTLGGAEILNGATISGAEAVRTAKLIHTDFALTSLLPQTELVVNRLIEYVVSNHSHIHFLKVSTLTKSDERDAMLASCQNGFTSNILAYNTFLGFSEKDTLGLLDFTNNVLDIHNMLKPLSTSYTQSGDGNTDPVTGGRPIEDGEASEKSDRSEG